MEKFAKGAQNEICRARGLPLFINVENQDKQPNDSTRSILPKVPKVSNDQLTD